MSDGMGLMTGVVAPPPGQVRSRCLRPRPAFVEFKPEDLEQSLSNRFERQVQKYLHRLAVKAGDQTVTYDELNRAANRVARAILARRGPGEEPVGLVFRQGMPLIVSLMGALKAGKMYVLLDPLFPTDRLGYMVEDSQAQLIVTDTSNFSLGHDLSQGRATLMTLDEVDAGLSDDNLGLSLSPDAAASIFYTSGSTGRPKGVIRGHRRRLHTVMVNTNDCYLDCDDRFSLLYSPSSGPAEGTILLALLIGASVFPFDVKGEDLMHLADWLIREQITCYNSVPTIFRHLVETLNGTERFPQLRLIKLGGEPVYRTDVELYKKHFSEDCTLHVSYGLSEAGGTLRYVIDKETEVSGHHAPLGYPVEGKEVSLLDESGNPVEVGEIGEIVIRSRYLADGYWHRPDLTAAAFRSDPTGGEERIYRTGDLGWQRPDGCFEFAGRKDAQVKIRGNRVEVAEIEERLREMAVVEEAAVVARADERGEMRLVAYWVAGAGPAPTVATLRGGLMKALPEYMIPSAYVKMEALPRLPNGKLDRRGLPTPDWTPPEVGGAYVAARTPVEELLVGTWSEVLGVEQVGVEDNFLASGGNSLLATQILSRVRQVFEMEIPLRDFLAAPTVAGLALTLVHRQAEQAKPEDMAQLLAELEELSDEEAQRLLIEGGQ